MKRQIIGVVVAMLASLAAAHAQTRPSAMVSGSAFLSPELKALEADDFAHPGMLWIEEGEQLWRRPDGAGGKSCAGCHGDATTAMTGVAARYPAMDAASGRLLNLENRINACRANHMSAAPFPYETNELLSLTAYIARQSRGMPIRVETEGTAAPWYARGEALFSMRQGQLNLSCAQCHVDRAGRKLRGDVISHGLGVGYPVYRLEWQGLGSLHRRLRACAFGVRATQFDQGSDAYVALELYLAKRAEGLPVDSPGLRK